MSKLSEFDKYIVIRPILGDCEYDQYEMPIIKKTDVTKIDWEKLKAQGYQNLSKRNNNSNSLVHMFLDDNRLLPLWNSPLKKVGLFQTCAAIATPDFSIYPSMNINEIRHNVYMNRWLGRTWQNYGITVLPTIGWSDSTTYDLCFSSIETGSPVVISTLGCHSHKREFLEGFNEMKKRIKPPIIVVYGNMIDGMTGNFINFKYKDCFSQNYEQLRLDWVSSIYEKKEIA